jgi:Ca2+-dependent lipid-binding protein
MTAKLVRDVETFGTMDPYCVIKLGQQALCSSISINSGKFPTWKDQFNFIVGFEEFLDLAIWDRRTVKGDEEIGSTRIPLADIINIKNFEGWFNISHGGADAGAVQLKVTYQSMQEGQTGQSQFSQYGNIRQEGNLGTQQMP